MINISQQFLREQVIEHQSTVPYTPQQNGVSEKKNRSLLDMVRCMLKDTALPDKFWGEGVMTATYIQNRLLTKSIEKNTIQTLAWPEA